MPPLNPEVLRAPNAYSSWHFVGQWVLAFLLCLCAQALLRAPGAEFWHADDGAHYVSSAMVAHWLSSGLGVPLGVALDYNGHYPLVGIGLWGPAFYGIFGVAISLLGGGHAVAQILTAGVIASLAAFTSWGVAQLAPRHIAWPATTLVAVLVVVLPLSVDQSLAFGLDAPVAVATCGAVFAFGHYLLKGSKAALLVFVALSLVGLLTKGNALALYLFGPLVLVLTRKPLALLDWRIWLSVFVISAVAVPWYVFSYGLTARGFRAEWGWEFTSQALWVNLKLLYATTGPIVLALAAWGAWSGVNRGGEAAVSLAGALAVYLFQSIVPASLNARYLLPMLPFVLLLAVVGAQAVLRIASARLRPALKGGLVLLLILSIMMLAYPSAKAYHGVGGSAAAVRKLLPPNNRSVLIVGFDVVETTFIAESAMLQPIKPDLYIIRGSRLLGGGGYNNFEYEPRFSTLEQIAAELAAYRVPIIVISKADRASRWAHINQVQTLLDQPGGGWRIAWRSDGADDIRIYVHDAHAKQTGSVSLIKELSTPRREVLSPSKAPTP